jgi:REP element-mobilizing transposase RayT
MPLLDHPPAGYRALRRGRASLAGQLYFVTFATFERCRIFEDCDAARSACRALVDPRSWRQSSLLAWVLMPDHCHVLLGLGEGDEPCRLVNRLKSHSARRLRSEGLVERRVWADGFHDRALRRDEDLVHVARYIVLNPIRAGLVRRVGDYPYWNAIWL